MVCWKVADASHCPADSPYCIELVLLVVRIPRWLHRKRHVDAVSGREAVVNYPFFRAVSHRIPRLILPSSDVCYVEFSFHSLEAFCSIFYRFVKMEVLFRKERV